MTWGCCRGHTTGLGLPLSRALARAGGGWLGLEDSTPVVSPATSRRLSPDCGNLRAGAAAAPSGAVTVSRSGTVDTTCAHAGAMTRYWCVMDAPRVDGDAAIDIQPVEALVVSSVTGNQGMLGSAGAVVRFGTSTTAPPTAATPHRTVSGSVASAGSGSVLSGSTFGGTAGGTGDGGSGSGDGGKRSVAPSSAAVRPSTSPICGSLSGTTTTSSGSGSSSSSTTAGDGVAKNPDVSDTTTVAPGTHGVISTPVYARARSDSDRREGWYGVPDATGTCAVEALRVRVAVE